DDTLDIAVRGFQRANVHAEAARDGRADLLRIQLLAFDLAALENVGGQRLEHGFLLEMEPERLHVPDQAALPVTDRGQWLGNRLRAPVETGPLPQRVDIHSPQILRKL